HNSVNQLIWPYVQGVAICSTEVRPGHTCNILMSSPGNYLLSDIYHNSLEITLIVFPGPGQNSSSYQNSTVNIFDLSFAGIDETMGFTIYQFQTLNITNLYIFFNNPNIYSNSSYNNGTLIQNTTTVIHYTSIPDLFDFYTQQITFQYNYTEVGQYVTIANTTTYYYTSFTNESNTITTLTTISRVFVMDIRVIPNPNIPDPNFAGSFKIDISPGQEFVDAYTYDNPYVGIEILSPELYRQVVWFITPDAVVNPTFSPTSRQLFYTLEYNHLV